MVGLLLAWRDGRTGRVSGPGPATCPEHTSAPWSRMVISLDGRLRGRGRVANLQVRRVCGVSWVQAASHAMGFQRVRYRRIVPEPPFGAHATPMPDDVDLSLPALATMVAEFLTEFDLHHVTLVRKDWRGAQLLMAAPIGSPTWSWSPARPSTTTRPGCRAGCCSGQT